MELKTNSVRKTWISLRIYSMTFPTMKNLWTIGEIALITNSIPDNTVTAVTPGEVIVINRSLFNRMIEDYPDMAVKLRDAMLGRLHRTIGDLRTVEIALRKEPASPERSQNGPSPEHDPTAEPSLAPNPES